MTDLATGVGILTCDTDLIVRSWDEWMARVTGVSAQQARGQPLAALAPDLQKRGLLARFQRVVQSGVVEVLAPAFHQYLIPCPPQISSRYFDHMQQKVTIAPLYKDNDDIVGALVTIHDVTARRERERKLGEQLTSSDKATRLRAMRALAEEEDAASMQTLTSFLSDESWRVRRVAVMGLVQHGGAKAVDTLLRALHQEHHNPDVLNSAIQVLVLSSLDVVAPLIEFISDPDADLRTYAALTLGERGDPRAIPALLAALQDKDTNVRFHAIEALGKLRAGQAVDALITIAQARDFYLSFPAIDALAAIGDPQAAPWIVPLLEDEILCAATVDALGQLGDEQIVAPLAALLNAPGAPTRASIGALAALYERYESSYNKGGYIADLFCSAIEPAGVQNLLDALDDDLRPEAQDDLRPEAQNDLRPLALILGWLEGAPVERALTQLLGQPSARNEAAQALVRYGKRATGLLIQQLEAEELETRQTAAVALGRIGDARAVPALARALADEELAITASGALAKIGGREAFEPLLELLDHPQASLRQAAIAALNSLGHPDMPARALALLRDPDPLLRQSAAKIAGYFGYPECADMLFQRCDDEDESVRQAALEGLPNLDDARVLPALAAALQDKSRKTRISAARALAQVESPGVLQHLLGALQDADPWVRYYAARSLGWQALPEALDDLSRVVKEDRATMVRASAAEALGRIGGARAAAILAPLVEAEEPDLSRVALLALGQTGHPDALAPLLAALRAPDPGQRLIAIKAMTQQSAPGAAEALQWVATTDTEPRIAQAAMEALARLATPEAVAALVSLTADLTCRETCIAASARLGEAHVEQIAFGLAHLHPAVRRATVNTLARITSPLASARLSEALQDEDASVRLEAVTALRRLGNRSEQGAMAELARSDPDPGVRRAAQAALRMT